MMGNSHPGKAQLQRQETISSEPSPKDPIPFVGVLLDGIVKEYFHETSDATKRKAEQLFQDLGLGRGIDATRVRPWLNRTSLQVRPVRFDDLIGTDEGGYMEAYKKAAHSSHSVQLQMQAQAHVPVTNGTAPSPKVEIGVDCDYARTISTDRCVVGRRVVNRTISFKENFQDLPSSESRRARFTRSTPLQPGAASGSSGKATLEEELCRWILERYQCTSCTESEEGDCKEEEGACICPDPEHCGDQRESSSPIVNFTEWFKRNRKSLEAESESKLCLDLCQQFVSYFRATHYVSSITLGAAELEIMTESEYAKEAKISGNFGLDEFVTSRAMASKSSHTTKKMFQRRTIGSIVEDEPGKPAHVPRSFDKEAVIKVEIKPIYHLTRHVFLGSLLKETVQNYMRDHRDSRMGPFYIVSHGIHDEKLYLDVDKPSLHLCVTRNEAEAKLFMIVQSEGKEQYEFCIVYEEEACSHRMVRSNGDSAELNFSAQKDCGQPSEPSITLKDGDQSAKPSSRQGRNQRSSRYYLCTPLTVRGTSSSPPCFQVRPKTKDCRFVLRRPLHSRGTPAEHLDAWLSGHKEYFIHCSGQYHGNGYLGVCANMDKSDREKITYVPTCCSSRNTGEQHSMLFQLLPVRIRDQPKATAYSRLSD